MPDSSQSSAEQHSPIRTQYLAIKREYPDALIFFRLGDFYETFDTDAEVVARELEITLTKREWGRGERSPMAGVPHHSAEGYISRLIARGYRVAVVEQTTEPTGHGLVEREVARIVTPGTVVDPLMVPAQRNNYLVAAIVGREGAGVAYADITTGEFACTQIAAGDINGVLAQEIARLAPAELLVEAPEQVRNGVRAVKIDAESDNAAEADETGIPDWTREIPNFSGHVTPVSARDFDIRAARERLLHHFNVATLEAFGCEGLPLAIRAAGAVLAYLQLTQRGAIDQMSQVQTYAITGFMALDAYTRRNLELFESGRDRQLKGSLCWVLDQTVTPMGSRLIRRWLGQPLLDLDILRRRHDAVEHFVADGLNRQRLRAALRKVGDLERLANRVLQRIATPRDLMALSLGLRAVEVMLSEVARADPALTPAADADLNLILPGLDEPIDPCSDVAAMIGAALVDEPPLALTEGGFIRAGYAPELDDLNERARGAREWIANLEAVERQRTGITNLKVGFNKVFGYFIEISNMHVAKAPKDYIRKQTVTTGERYITPALKEYESLVLNAQERQSKLEYDLFVRLRQDIATMHAERIVATARALATLDVLAALAEVAERNHYVRPTLNDATAIHIVAGRHPVIEVTQRDQPFVPNDLDLDNDATQILLLTGPNMAGKSTIMRQIALIVLMAQLGSFVPAEAATIGLVDRIFTRIGAQDDLATGQSTFMVEMVETANILRHATTRSLIVLDEIGRGTSTYDGLAIARAIVEFLHQHPRSGAKTLFATHYHELVEIARALPHVRPATIAVTEEDGHVVFLRTLIPGGADRSYGIHVAQLAGLPRPVLRRAEEILAELERKGEAQQRRKTMRDMPTASEAPPTIQLSLFQPPATPDPVLEQLRELRVEELTPLEALQLLYRWQSDIKNRM